MTLKKALVRMIEYWPYLPDTNGVSCSVQFTDAEMDGFFEQEQVGVSEDGWVSNEGYKEAVQGVAEPKDFPYSDCRRSRGYPFTGERVVVPRSRRDQLITIRIESVK